MSYNYVPCFKKIDFAVISSYIELPCDKQNEIKKHFANAGTNVHKKYEIIVKTRWTKTAQKNNV